MLVQGLTIDKSSCIVMTGSSHWQCYALMVRTTITLDDDVAAAVHDARQSRSMGLINELIRAGLQPRQEPRRQFRQRSHSMALRIDVRNVADALEVLEGPLDV